MEKLSKDDKELAKQKKAEEKQAEVEKQTEADFADKSKSGKSG